MNTKAFKAAFTEVAAREGMGDDFAKAGCAMVELITMFGPKLVSRFLTALHELEADGVRFEDAFARVVRDQAVHVH